jgi:hypothetical protein
VTDPNTGAADTELLIFELAKKALKKILIYLSKE